MIALQAEKEVNEKRSIEIGLRIHQLLVLEELQSDDDDDSVEALDEKVHPKKGEESQESDQSLVGES